MKNLYLLLAALLCGFSVFAQEAEQKPAKAPVFDWSLLWSGGWDPSSGKEMLTKGNLYNRGELKIGILPLGITLRGQILDRRPLNLDIESIARESEEDPLSVNGWLAAQDTEKAVTHFQGALYHNPTGSRLLYGALDEWGLSARVRNPWIRSAPFPENHKPAIADLKTSASSTKEDEIYMYLSSPFIRLAPSLKTRAFAAAKTETGDIAPEFKPHEYAQSAAASGLEFALPNKSNLLIETFYTWKKLPPTNNKSWFTDPPPLPARDFNLAAAGLLFANEAFSLSSDFAISETFAWGKGYYANFGASVFLPADWLKFWDSGRITKPLTVSLSADWADGRIIYSDALDHGKALRVAAKASLKGARNSLLQLSASARGPDYYYIEEKGFTRSSANLYFRMPSPPAGSKTGSETISFIRLSRISISADRNADNPEKISDRLYGYFGITLNLPGINTPIGMVFNGSITRTAAFEGKIQPFPSFTGYFIDDSFSTYCEISYNPSIYQFKTRFGYTNNEKNEEIWDFSASGSVRFKAGRLGFKIASPNLPDMWNFTISWNLEAK